MLGGDGDSNHDWCHDVRTNVLLPLHLIPPGLCPGEKSQKLGFQFSRFTIQSLNSIRGLAAGTISLVCVGRKNAGRLGTRMWGLIWVRSCAGLAQHCWSAVDVSITSLLLIWFISTANLTISTRKREAPRIICHQSLSLHRNLTHELSRICQSLWWEKLAFLSKIWLTLQLSRQQAPGSPTTTMTPWPTQKSSKQHQTITPPLLLAVVWQQQQHRISVGEIICDVSYSSSFVLRVILKWFITRKNAHSQIILSLL